MSRQLSTGQLSTRTLVFAAVACLLLLGYWQRGPLLRAGLDFALADTPLTLVDLQGLRLARSGLQLQQVDFLLPARGQTLVITDLALGWHSAGLFALPQPQSLHIGSARLAAAPGSEGSANAAPATVDVAGLLQLLRSFPLASITLAALELPGSPAPLQADVTASPGNFAASVRSADLDATLTLLQPDATAEARLQLQFRSDGRASGQLEFTLPPALEAGQVSGRGSFEVQGLWDSEPFGLDGTLDLPPCTLARSAQCALHFDAGGTLAAWTAAAGSDTAARIEGLAMRGSGALGLDAETLQWRLSAASFDGTLAALHAGAYHLSSAFSLREVELALGAALQGSLRLRTAGLVLQTPQPWLPSIDLDAGLALAGTRLDFDAAVLFRDGSVATDLRVQGSHDLAGAAGTASVTLPPLQLAAGSTLGQRLGQWPYTWDLVLGTVEAGLQLQWQDVAATPQRAAGTQVTGSLTASLADVAGYYGASLFRGLATGLSGEIDTTRALPLATPPLQLGLAELDVGLPLRDLVLRVQLDAAANSVIIESLTGTLLGGSVAMQQQRYDFGTADNMLALQFDGLRLEQVLALTGYEDIAVEGGVSGAVPLRFSDSGIAVAGGTLSAQQPGGSIRYLGTLGQGDASLALVRQALSNYRFDAMDSSIDYSPDGELQLRMQLQGYNPELENGRRVNLNLNLSDNVPALLQSLQAGRAIEDLVQELYE